MKVLLLHLDGKLPNLALMRISMHHKSAGDEVVFHRVDNPKLDLGFLLDHKWDKAYGSLIFERTRPHAENIQQLIPDIILGGTGWDVASNLSTYGISEMGEYDYTLYPSFVDSIGFSQRGCRLRCSFCVVPRKEGAIKPNLSINEIWRGGDYPRNILLLDNDFFGQPDWRVRCQELIDGKFKVCFCQGINARLINQESAETLAQLNYKDDSFKVKRIYTAWDNRKDEERLFTALNLMCKYGVKPDHIMVYILVGYWPGETHDDRNYRRQKLREFGARPYPMPFVRNKELVGFQRWVIGAYDKRVPWEDWEQASYRPEKLGDKFLSDKRKREMLEKIVT